MSQSPAPDSQPTPPSAVKNILRRLLSPLAVRGNWGAIWIALLYTLIIGVWILFSDRIVVLIAPDPAALLTINTLKGWGSVIFASVFLYWLIRRHTIQLLEVRLQSAAAVQSAAEKYHNIVENAIEGIFQTTPEGRYLAANPALARIFGYDSPADLMADVQDITRQTYVDPKRRAEFIRRLTAEGEIHAFENQVYRRDGSMIWIQFNVRAVRDATGEVLYYEGSLEDITERKQAEEQAQSLARFPSENPNPVLRLGRDGTILYANSASRLLLQDWGCEQGDRAPLFWQQVAHETLADKTNRNIDIASGDITFSLFITPVVEADYVNLYGRDITERKRAELAQQRTEEHYRKLADNFPNGVVNIYDRELRMIFVSGQELQQSGRPAADFLGKHFQEVAPLQTWALAEPALRAAFNGQTGEYETTYWGDQFYHVTVAPLYEADGLINEILVVSRNITAQRRAEEQIRFQASLLEQVRNAVIATDMQGQVVYCNHFGETLYGWAPAEMLGRNIFDIVVPTTGEPQAREAMSTLERQGFWEGEFVVRRKDDTEFAAHIMDVLIKDTSGKPIGMAGVSFDITDRKRAEEALHMSQTRFQRYFELGLIGLAITSPTKGWIEVNDEICKILGYQREELLQTIWPELTHPDDLAADVANFDRVLAGEIDGYSMDKRFIRKDGQIVYASIALNCQRRADGSVDYFMALLHDITERRQAEAAERDQRALAEALRDTAAAVNSTLDFEEILDRILGNIERVVPLTTANVMLHKGNILQIVRARGFESYVRSLEHMPQVFVLNDYANLRSIVATGQPQLIEDTRQYRDWVVMPELEWIRSFLSVPIMIDSQVVGLINLNADQPGFYTTDHMTRLQAFSDQAAIALKNARLLIEAHERAEELKLSQEQLRAVSTRAESMREEERITIAREIHDDLGQSLTGLKMDLAWLTKRLPASQQRASLQTKLQDMSDLIDQLIQSVRRIATELRPGVLDDLGLIAAIEWQADDFQSRTGIVCKTAANVTDTALNKNQATAVFRIFLETLTNVARHAQATHIQIRLNELKRVFTLDVLDNGRGLPDDAINDPKSLGLAGMRERALAVGGQLSIVGAAEGGTLMRLSVPLEHA